MRDCLFELVPIFSDDQMSVIVSALIEYCRDFPSFEVDSLILTLRSEVEHTRPFPWSADELVLVAKALKASSGFKSSSGLLCSTLASQIMQFVSADRVVLHSDFVSVDKDLSFERFS